MTDDECGGLIARADMMRGRVKRVQVVFKRDRGGGKVFLQEVCGVGWGYVQC